MYLLAVLVAHSPRPGFARGKASAFNWWDGGLRVHECSFFQKADWCFIPVSPECEWEGKRDWEVQGRGFQLWLCIGECEQMVDDEHD